MYIYIYIYIYILKTPIAACPRTVEFKAEITVDHGQTTAEQGALSEEWCSDVFLELFMLAGFQQFQSISFPRICQTCYGQQCCLFLSWMAALQKRSGPVFEHMRCLQRNLPLALWSFTMITSPRDTFSMHSLASVCITWFHISLCCCLLSCLPQ
jgi:hypothetical protein